MSGRASATPWHAAAAVLALAALAAPRLGAQEGAETRLQRAAGLFEALHVEQARDSLRALLRTEPAPPERIVLDAHTLLGVLHHALGADDSTRAHFAAVVEADVFASLDADAHNPEVVRLFFEARRSVPAVGLAVEPPLTVDPLSDSLRVRVAIGMPGSAEVTLHPGSAEDAPAVLRSRATLDADSVIGVPLTVAADSAIEPGRYTLRTAYATRAGETRDAAVTLEVTRQPVDTAAHLPPPDSSTYRPETRKGGPSVSSLVTGVVVGAASVALPMALWNGDLGSAELRTGAVAVGGSVAIAGIVGMVVGRPDVPIPANIEFNRQIVGAWRADNERIAADNDRRRRAARLTIRVVRQP